MTIDQIIGAAKLITLEEGQAIYLHRGTIEVGRDGCQPSNSICLSVYGNDTDWDEVEEQLDDSDTADVIREATEDEAIESAIARPEGHILVDGRRCYVAL